MKLPVMIGVFGLLGFSAFGEAFTPGNEAICNDDNVNIREAGSPTAKVVGMLQKGISVVIIVASYPAITVENWTGKYIKIRFGKLDGWVFSKYLDEVIYDITGPNPVRLAVNYGSLGKYGDFQFNLKTNWAKTYGRAIKVDPVNDQANGCSVFYSPELAAYLVVAESFFGDAGFGYRKHFLYILEPNRLRFLLNYDDVHKESAERGVENEIRSLKITKSAAGVVTFEVKKTLSYKEQLELTTEIFVYQDGNLVKR